MPSQPSFLGLNLEDSTAYMDVLHLGVSIHIFRRKCFITLVIKVEISENEKNACNSL
jgi:hypothetical protein